MLNDRTVFDLETVEQNKRCKRVRIKRRTGIRNTEPECGTGIRNRNAESEYGTGIRNPNAEPEYGSGMRNTEPELRIKHGNGDETSNWVF